MNENKCSICGSPMKTIPAGVSKATGKPYNSFEVCEKGCRKPSPNDEKFERLINGMTMIHKVLEEIRDQYENDRPNN